MDRDTFTNELLRDFSLSAILAMRKSCPGPGPSPSERPVNINIAFWRLIQSHVEVIPKPTQIVIAGLTCH